MKTPLLLSLTLIGASSLSAALVNVIAFDAGSSDFRYVQSNGSALPSTATLDYGVLDVVAFNALSVAQQTDYAFLTGGSGPFTTIGTFNFNASGEINSTGNPYPNNATTAGLTGQQAFTLVYTNEVSGSEIGLFSTDSAAWTLPNPTGLAPVTLSNAVLIDGSGTDSAYLGSLIVPAAGDPGVFLTTANVPEPSAIAAILAGVSLMGAGLRRRR